MQKPPSFFTKSKQQKNLVILLIILLITPKIITQCLKGCLKCESNDQCTLCDTTESYKLQNFQCIDHKPINCKQISLEGNCLECIANHYLNPTEKSCQKVDTAKLVKKCILYDSSMNCSECKRDYYVNSGQCVAVTNLIKNCEINQTNQLCKVCENNYLLSLNRKQCVNKTPIANCQYWSTVTCEKCQSGYFLNQNYYFEEWYQLVSVKEKMKLLEKIHKLKFGIAEMMKQDVCQKIEIENCEIFESHNSCSKCEENFFLNPDKNCVAYPQEKIKNCYIYETANNCIECVQGYFLRNNICEQVVVISNCSKYNPRENTSKCIECAADYILRNTTCSKRQSSNGSKIANCRTKHPYEDKCEKCQDKYVESTDGLKCFATISNCKQHSQVGSTSQNFLCKECNDGYFLNDKTCQTGSVPHCKVFEAITTCKECEHQHFLEDDTHCGLNNIIENCLSYDGITQNAHHTCKVCENGTFNFQINKYCKDVDTIPNCKVYKRDVSTATCSQCNPGFFKVSDTTCNAFNDTNCTSGNAVSVCTSCNADFALDRTGSPDVCRPPHEFVTQNCELHTAGSSNNLEVHDVECNYCKANFFPWDMQNGFVCVKENDYLRIGGVQGQEQIEHCHKYNSAKKCLQCKENYYLQIANDGSISCIQECENGFSKQINVIFNDQFGFQSINANKCVVDSGSCLVYGSLVFSSYGTITGPLKDSNNNQDSNKICIQCNDINLPSINPNFQVDKISNQNFLSNTFLNLVLDPLEQHPEVDCATSDYVNGAADTQEIKNCSFYSKYKLDDKFYFYCIRCKIGYQGQVLKTKLTIDNVDTDISYIKECQKYDNCDLNVNYYNLPPVYNSSSSCHICNDNTIPFIPLLVDNTTYEIQGLHPYDLSGTDFKDFDENQQQNSINCFDPQSPSQFGDASKFQHFPDNCGLGVINLTSSDGDSTDSKKDDSLITLVADLKLAIFCGACKPGYKQVPLHASLIHIAVKCETIENCSSSNQVYFNACSECKKGFVFEYTQDKNINYQKCVEHSSNNCLAAQEGVSNNEGYCIICKKGYVLNFDHFCEEITAAKCTTSLGSVQWNEMIDKMVLNYMIFSIPQGNGCNSCSSGYVALQVTEPTIVCSISPYIASNLSSFDYQSNKTTKSAYIQNCQGYTLNPDIANTLQCKKCSSNNILNKNGSKCLSSVPNCKIASSTNDEQCAECEPGYALISDICQAGNIANCATYEVKLSQNTIKCKTCNPGYYSDSNRTLCKLGIVPHCRVYIENNSKQCSECEEGFEKISKEVDVCFHIEPQLNCKTAIIDSKNDEVMCTDCKLQNQIFYAPSKNIGSTDNQTICMRHNLVENCEEYDLGIDIQRSTFLCKQCNSGFYLKDYYCKQRLVLPPACAVYEIDEDKCQQCASGNYLMNSGKDCEAYPTGIIGCRIFSQEYVCQACKANNYLINNQCLLISPENLVDNCLYYSLSQTCSECNSGYVLISTQCTQANAQNCNTYTSIDACATCKQNYFLKTEGGRTNCVTANKANCLEYEQFGKCIKCSQNYFPNEEGECQFSNPLILGCIYYESNDLCKQCEQDKALSEDKKCVDQIEVVGQIDPFCTLNKVMENPVCSACQPGYFFFEGRCKACEQNKIEKGCFSCDYKNDKVCLVCNSGFYMNKDGVCVIANPVQQNISGPTSGIQAFESWMVQLVLLLIV